MIFIIVFLFIARFEVGIEKLLYVISGSTSEYYSFFAFSIGLVINSIFIILSLYIINFDLDSCYENIFLRISKEQWIYGKCISLFMINLFMCLFIVGIHSVYSIFIINKIDFSMINFIPVLLLSKYIIQLIFFIFNILNIKGKIVISYVILIFPIFSNIKLFRFIYVTDYNSILVFITAIILILFMIIIINKNILNIFERRI